MLERAHGLKPVEIFCGYLLGAVVAFRMNNEGKLLYFKNNFLLFVLEILTGYLCASISGTELVEYFRDQMKKDPDMASAVAAIRTLLEFLKRDKG